MISRRGERTGQAAGWGLAVGLAALGLGAEALAQGHTPDPYNIVGEYNRQYEPYMFSTTPNDESAMPNQFRLDGRAGNRNANQFQSMLDNPDGEPGAGNRSEGPRSLGAGVPYYKANRLLDAQTPRGRGPNQYADRTYLADQQGRNEKYFQALRETDPKKRAQLFREYHQDNLRSALSLSGGRNAPAPARARDEPDPDRDRDRTAPGAAPPPRSGESLGAGRRPGRSPAIPSSTRPGPGSAPPPTSRLTRPRVGPSDTAPRLRSRTSSGTFRGFRDDRNAPSAVMDRSELLDREAGPSRSRTTAPPPASRPAR